MTKQRVFVKREDVDLDYLFSYTDPDAMMAGAKYLYDKYNKAAFEKSYLVEFETQWAGYDGGTQVVANFYRYETDKEYTQRLELEAAKKEKARKAKETKKANALAKALETEAEERALYEKLKEKFGV